MRQVLLIVVTASALLGALSGCNECSTDGECPVGFYCSLGRCQSEDDWPGRATSALDGGVCSPAHSTH